MNPPTTACAKGCHRPRPASTSCVLEGQRGVEDEDEGRGRFAGALFRLALKGGLAGILLFAPCHARAGGVVTNLTEQGLRNALAGGGLVTFGASGTIALAAPIAITNDTTISGAGFSVRLSGRGGNGLFVVAAKLALGKLTLADGVVTNGGGLWILPTGEVVATNCTFTNNRAVGTNGVAGAAGADTSGIGGEGKDGANGVDASGGAIFNQGRLTLLGCEFLTNSAVAGNGGVGGAGGKGAFRGGNGGRGGSGGAAYGGAVCSTSSMVVSNCTFSGNSVTAGDGAAGGAAGEGGSVALNGNGGAGGRGGGAALCCRTNATIVNCTFEGNRGFGGDSAAGGQRANTNGSDGAPGGDAEGAGLWTAGSCAVTNCTFSANEVTGGNGGDGGAGILIGGDGGRGGYGAGGSIFNSGTLDVVNCTLAGGSSMGGFGGFAGTGPSAGDDGSHAATRGGNIANGSGTFRLLSSILAYPVSGTNSYTLTNVVAVETNVPVEVVVVGTNTFYSTNTGCPLPGPPLPPPNCTTNIVFTNGDQLVTNTFFLTNSGCGVFSLNPACLTNIVFTNTVTSNYTVQTFVTNVVNATNIAAALNAFGTITDAGHNISSDASPTFGSHSWNNTDPKLGSLASNGGPTKTFALTSGSPALHAGDDAACARFDQRAYVRPSGARSDIGAVEMGAPMITTEPQSQTVTNGATVEFSVKASGEVAPGYQWRFNGVDLAGATSTRYRLTNVQLVHAGGYTVVAANPYGVATSQVATLTVIFRPQLFRPSLLSTTHFAFAFTTRPGHSYFVEYKNELTNGNWTRHSTNAGTGNLLTNVNPTAGVPSRYFRVVEQ